MIYTKIEDGKRHLYITAEGTDVPGADDVELTYKNELEEEVNVDDYKFFYNAGFDTQQIKACTQRDTITPEDIDLNVYDGDTLIIGTIHKVEVTLNGDIPTNTTMDINGTELSSEVKSVEITKGTNATVTITADKDTIFVGVPTITIGESTSNFTVNETNTIATFEIEEVNGVLEFSVTASAQFQGGGSN